MNDPSEEQLPMYILMLMQKCSLKVYISYKTLPCESVLFLIIPNGAVFIFL
jgi:hypothetical protein